MRGRQGVIWSGAVAGIRLVCVGTYYERRSLADSVDTVEETRNAEIPNSIAMPC